HLQTMCDFWSSVLLMTGRYHGQPMRKHAPLPIGGVHFDRWLELFEAAARRRIVHRPRASHRRKPRARHRDGARASAQEGRAARTTRLTKPQPALSWATAGAIHPA